MSRVAVITGATSGIGLATARLLIENGYTVYGVARRAYSGNDFKCYTADIFDFDAIDAVLDDVVAREGGIDVFVNNAGVGIAGSTEEISAENTKRIVNVNLTAMMVLCGKAAALMKTRGGKIVNISSVGAIMPLPYQAAYSATKAGVEIFSRALANELKPYNIKVTAVLPGDTKTCFGAARIVDGENSAARRSVAKMERDENNGKSPECVAKVIYKVIKRKHPPLRISVGFISKVEVFLSRFLSVKCLNRILYSMYGGKK